MGFSVTRRGPSLAVVSARLLRVTPAEAAALLELQKSRILARLDKGVDLDGRPFAPYSDAPFYYTPRTGARLSGAGAEAVAKAERSAVTRLLKRIGGPAGTGSPRPSRTGRSIFFPGGYRQFKAWLGRRPGLVDLTGPRAPHMRQAITQTVVERDGSVVARQGIYGEEAARARGHQTGAGRLPVREWFGVGRSDLLAIRRDIERIKKARKA